MENSNKIIPPHLNAEVYRTATTGTSIITYLDYIRVHEEGSVLIGRSELTGRYWNGGVNIFKSVTEALKIDEVDNTSICLSSGTADACFVDTSDKVLLLEDSGAVSIWSSCGDEQNAWHQWREEISVAEHDDAALAVDCLDPGVEYVTVGADGNAKVWDVKEMICTRNYSAAHSKPIYGVSARPKSCTDFATGSMDQYVSLWDENIDKPVLDLVKNDCCIRCLKWLDENKLIFGDEAGVLSLVDVRNPETTFRLSEFPAAVHGLAVHSEGDKVAVCCDNKIVSVCDVSEDADSKVIYHDRHMHSNFARGVAWDVGDKKLLHSIGWDGKMKSHNIVWK